MGLLLAAGCETYSVELTAPEVLTPTGTLRVGAAREEITPPPGLPMGGYGFIGKTARGFWTRLWANALVIEDPSGVPLVLVSTDLWAMHGGLADEVAARVAADPRGSGIGREHIVLAATHTHQSPGAFGSSVGYNMLSAPKTRWDPALFDFLAARISRAILRAAETRAPATMSWREAHLAQFVRNRQLDAFVLNPESETADFLDPGSAVPYCELRAPVPDRAACRAVDATVTVIRFEREERIVGAAVFAALHPTAGGPGVGVYSSDVYGVAGILAARQLAPVGDGNAPVLAFFNGAEGDVSPDWRTQDGPNAVALGRRLGSAVVQLAKGGTKEAEVRVAHAFERFALAGACRTDDDGKERCAASRPMVGRATMGGATDGRTHTMPSLFRSGVTRTAWGPQGVKVPALDPGFGWFRLPISALIMMALRGPETTPLGVYRLGPFALATLPGEFTTMMGRRIAQGVARALPSSERVLLVGLANEYASYFTTPEEYGGQFYEGSSTLLGPESGPVIGDALVRLADGVARGEGPRLPTRESIAYAPGPSRSFGLTDVDTPHVSDAHLGPLLHEPPYDRGPAYPSYCWKDETSAFPDVHLPTVRIEIAKAENAWEPLAGVDNHGTDIITVASPRDDGKADWRAIWMPGADVPPTGRFRFVATSIDGARYTGTPFQLDAGAVVSGCPEAADANE